MIQKQLQFSDRELVEEIRENPPPTGGGEDDGTDSGTDADSNSGTLILDATCAPQNISYPQDVNLLNEARVDLEKMIEVERAFSLAKRNYGLGLITAKLDTTTRSSIALSIIAMNVNCLTVISFAQFLISVFSRDKQCIALQQYKQNKSYETLQIC